MTPADATQTGGRAARPRLVHHAAEDFHDENEGTLAWWQQPNKLAAVALVMVIVLNIIFW